MLGRIIRAQKYSQKTRKPDCWPDTGDESEPEYEISEHSTGLRSDAPEQSEVTAKAAQDTGAMENSEANSRSIYITDALALRLDEINLQLTRLCTSRGEPIVCGESPK